MISGAASLMPPVTGGNDLCLKIEINCDSKIAIGQSHVGQCLERFCYVTLTSHILYLNCQRSFMGMEIHQ